MPDERIVFSGAASSPSYRFQNPCRPSPYAGAERLVKGYDHVVRGSHRQEGGRGQVLLDDFCERSFYFDVGRAGRLVVAPYRDRDQRVRIEVPHQGDTRGEAEAAEREGISAKAGPQGQSGPERSGRVQIRPRRGRLSPCGCRWPTTQRSGGECGVDAFMRHTEPEAFPRGAPSEFADHPDAVGRGGCEQGVRGRLIGRRRRLQRKRRAISAPRRHQLQRAGTYCSFVLHGTGPVRPARVVRCVDEVQQDRLRVPEAGAADQVSVRRLDFHPEQHIPVAVRALATKCRCAQVVQRSRRCDVACT